jgi:hypothetical protein
MHRGVHVFGSEKPMGGGNTVTAGDSSWFLVVGGGLSGSFLEYEHTYTV